MAKEWRYIEGSDNAYVSPDGDVMRNGKIVEPKTDPEGYLRVSVGGEIKRERVHRLVAKYYIPNTYNKPFVNHRNGKKNINKSSNLEWCTPRENSLLAARRNHARAGGKKQRIIATNVSTGEKEEFESQAAAGRKYGITSSEINKALRGKRYTAHGYMFEYCKRGGENENKIYEPG